MPYYEMTCTITATSNSSGRVVNGTILYKPRRSFIEQIRERPVAAAIVFCDYCGWQASAYSLDYAKDKFTEHIEEAPYLGIHPKLPPKSPRGNAS